MFHRCFEQSNDLRSFNTIVVHHIVIRLILIAFLCKKIAIATHFRRQAGVEHRDARLTGGVWEFTTSIHDGMTCPDGSTAPIQETYKFDDLTMSGTRSVIHNDVCGLPASITNLPFTLAFNRAVPIPVDQYPLYCEPGGLKRCF